VPSRLPLNGAQTVYQYSFDSNIFDRTAYDFAATTNSCLSEKGNTCSVDIGYTNYVVVENPRFKNPNIEDSSPIDWECEALIWFYCALFISLFIVSLLVVIIVYKLCVAKCLKNSLCCCLRDDAVTKEPIYDNFGNNSTSDIENIYDTVSNRWSAYNSRDLRSMYGDTSSHISESSHYLKKLFRESNRTVSTLPTRSKMRSQSMYVQPTSQAATIYTDHRSHLLKREQNESMDAADSGISTEQDFSPTGYSSPVDINAFELQPICNQYPREIYNNNYDHQPLHTKRTLPRPKSAIDPKSRTLPHHTQQFQQRQTQIIEETRHDKQTDNSLDALHDQYYSQAIRKQLQSRPYSVMSQGDYQRYLSQKNTDIQFVPHSEADGMAPGLEYDDTELYL
jgi:hypothetical protein